MSHPDDDALLEFAPNDPPDGLVRQSADGAVPPPIRNEIDGLVDAISAGGRPRWPDDTDVIAEADDLAPADFTMAGHVLQRWGPDIVHTAVFRYIACSIVAFAFGSAIAWGVLRSFDPPAPVSANAPQPASIATVKTPPSTPLTSPTPAPIASSMPAPVRPAPVAVATDRQPPTPTPRVLATPDAAPKAVAKATLPAVSASRSIAPRPIAPAVLPPPPDVAPKGGVDLASVASLVPAAALVPAPPPAAVVVSPLVLDQKAVLETLREYTQAYEALDVKATVAVWPSVDRRALARAFSTLKSHQLELDDCKITIADAKATTRCRGTAEYVRKVGSSTPRTEYQDLTFKMRKLGNEWFIDEVSASELAVARR